MSENGKVKKYGPDAKPLASHADVLRLVTRQAKERLRRRLRNLWILAFTVTTINNLLRV